MTVNLIALVGPHGEIGHSDGSRPEFQGVRESMDWFLSTVGSGVVVCGRKTVDQMVRDGVDLGHIPYNLAVFTRQNGPPTAMDYLRMLSGAFPGQDIFIAGGLQTYEAFLPFCQNFFIRKADIRGRPDLFLPQMFTPKGTIH